jgi:polyhydroxyalkanoate synthesis regulator phasin
MPARSEHEPDPDPSPSESRVTDSVRAAVERTMRATAGSAVTSRERAAELVDEVVRRGRDARDQLARRGQEAGAEISRRGQEAGAELARRGQEATGEVGRRLEALERRLAELESSLGTEPEPARKPQSKPKAEG